MKQFPMGEKLKKGRIILLIFFSKIKKRKKDTETHDTYMPILFRLYRLT